jgi:hypothetical protein
MLTDRHRDRQLRPMPTVSHDLPEPQAAVGRPVVTWASDEAA